VAGDMFDSPLPDMNVVQEASEALWQLRNKGVRAYIFHGSHDRSPTESGIVDVLAATRLFELVDQMDLAGLADLADPMGKGGDVVSPSLVRDGPTGAVIAAVGGMRGGLEREALARVDGRALQEACKDAPLAIFGFHGSVEGMLPRELAMLDTVPRGSLPPGFHYYALGHIHHREVVKEENGVVAAYPGPTFGATFTDLADPRPKGLLVVEADGAGACETEFVPVETAPVARIDLDVGGKSGIAAHEKLMAMVEAGGWEGRVVLLRVGGTLGQGRPAEIGVTGARDALLDQGALSVHVSRASLKGADAGPAGGGAGAGDGAGGGAGDGNGSTDPMEVSRRVLARRIEGHETEHAMLREGAGRSLAWDLVEVLKQERGAMKVGDHNDAILEQAMALLGTPGRAGSDEGGDAPRD
jgi:hypothetical protein